MIFEKLSVQIITERLQYAKFYSGTWDKSITLPLNSQSDGGSRLSTGEI